MSEIVSIKGAGLAAEINPLGAELHALRDADGRDLLWDGDPAFWTGRAPILFPVIGCVNGGVIRVDGKEYPMAKHGFARRRHFTVIAQDEGSATFSLADDDETRKSYPFAFRLDIRFAIEGEALTLTATAHNLGDTPMPASFGFHPALRWPLPYSGARADHRIRFDAVEPEPIRRIDGDGFLRPAPVPSPIEGDTLTIRDDLFSDDAVILDAPHARGLAYGAPGTPGLRVEWDLPQLGIWTKPGAPYLCIEPWAGIADPEGFVGDIFDKPGIVAIPAGESHSFSMKIARD
ncbi:galactose mutarotase-like enzyme [Sphingomonas vulcanisoli]|uniref:Galactose mutarotase-like enzyme n=1 Tax=Sphingomonas vulcanisoli TaxID=1658060 RepID=A0ABX0TPG4_9SPHN|nr:aldose 1-epimerase family protein [Sphingomonas vulcanisoli]NIJ07423.1 galactose mutarotase-like enzyme [Sphingomonas vulcanisoli]